MILLRCAKLPEGHESYVSEEFSDYERSQLEATGADYAVYWYGSGCYCGTGHILARKGGRWYHHGCGHCSCYGPTSDINFSYAGAESVEALLAECSEELRRELEPLVGVL